MLRQLNDAIRSVTNNQRLVKIARGFHIASVLKRYEYRLRGPSDGLIRHAIGGVQVVFAAPDATEFRTLECCYRDELDFIEALEKRLRGGGVFYDIGSNVGQFLIPVAKIVGERGRVIGFEPHPGNHQRLIRNIALNGLTNATVFQLALGDRNGQIQIFGTRGIATIVPHAANQNKSSPAAIIPLTRGDDLRRRAGLPLPKAVKIDVEGAEFAVLSGLKETLSSPVCELLCLEIHPRFIPAEVSPEMVLSLVRSLGFNRSESRQCTSRIHLIAEKEEA
ncbi:MAG: FkbM family methyltransferase [Terriglobia bacterium]